MLQDSSLYYQLSISSGTDKIGSAGVTDSALTNHGILQARRLGSYLAPRYRFTHIFSSDLQRAYKTAGAIRQSQRDHYRIDVGIRQLQILQEQDFGKYEGKSFGARTKSPSGTPASGQRAIVHGNEPESKAAMFARMDVFLDHHLLPVLLRNNPGDSEAIVAVVSHGMTLSALWRCLLKRFALYSVTVGHGVDLRIGDVMSLERLGAWSNTGYLELSIEQQVSKSKAAGITDILVAETKSEEKRLKDTTTSSVLYGWKMTIRAVNHKPHLQGFKRTGGGLGSSRHDENQKNIDTFFKKRRVE